MRPCTGELSGYKSSLERTITPYGTNPKNIPLNRVRVGREGKEEEEEEEEEERGGLEGEWRTKNRGTRCR
jgi:hypothetical protein